MESFSDKSLEEITSALEELSGLDWNKEYGETGTDDRFYSWEAYVTEFSGFKVYIQKGEVNSLQRNSEPEPMSFRLRLLKGRKVAKKFNDDRLEELYDTIRKKELETFWEIIEKLTLKTPEYWEKKVYKRMERPEDLVETLFQDTVDSYTVTVGGLNVTLSETRRKTWDTPEGIAFPYPYESSDCTFYQMLVKINNKKTKVFFGEEFTPYIKSSIEILRDYHEQKESDSINPGLN